MSEQGMVSKTTTSPRTRAFLLPQQCRMLTEASNQGVGTGGWDPALTVDVSTAKAQILKNKTHHPLQMISQVTRSCKVLSQAETQFDPVLLP